ncbi:MFS transporter [Alteribacillus sp. HJP-4]|uniref:MFS transporter n=1 Tax=Alteribacillus sp. HJP-4 TaxID=2775394 RepID=UPI0035CD0404
MAEKLLKMVLGDVEVTKDLNLLLVIGGLYAIAVALSNTFVNIYFWKQSGEITTIAYYQLASVISQPLAFLAGGYIAKKADRIVALRIGVFVLTFFYIAVLLFGSAAHSYIIILGILLGLGFGFYWLGYNVLTFEITEPETRDFFNGFSGLLTSFAGMIGPLSAGLFITWFPETTGYQFIFFVSFALFMLAVFLTFKMKHRPARGPLNMAYSLSEIKFNVNWRNILFAHFSQGIREGIFVFIIVLWVYLSTNSELALGTYGFITSAVSFAGYYVVSRFLKITYRKKAILYGGVALTLAVFLIVFELKFKWLMLYGVIISIAYPLLLVPYISMTFDVLGKARRAASRRIEYLIIREWFLNAGRITSIVLLLLSLSIFEEKIIIPVMMSVCGAGHLFISFFIRRISFEKE